MLSHSISKPFIGHSPYCHWRKFFDEIFLDNVHYKYCYFPWDFFLQLIISKQSSSNRSCETIS